MNQKEALAAIQSTIRDVADFPKPGVVFKDITPILANAELLHITLDLLSERYLKAGIDKVAAIDARGFLFGAAVADRLGAGLVLLRKQGKLPYHTFDETYELEYGQGTLCMHQDALHQGQKVLIIDDLLATGGTAAAAAHLVEQGGGQVVEIEFLVELTFLKGRERLTEYSVRSLITF